LGHVINLATGEHKAVELTDPLHQCVDLGRQSAARAAERLGAVFFGAPAAC
jgi:hypothetical protein